AVARAADTLQARQQPYTPEQLAAQRQAVAEAEAELRQQLDPGRRAAVERQREQLLQAEQQLALLRSRGTPADLIDLQQAAERARAELATARAALESARLVAPFDGVVAQVNVSPGERVGDAANPAPGAANTGAAPGGRAALILVDSARPGIDLAVGEAALRELAIGQLAVVTADGLPGQEVVGVVGRIGPLGTPSEGVMTYPVQVRLDAALPLPLGAAVRLAVPIA